MGSATAAPRRGSAARRGQGGACRRTRSRLPRSARAPLRLKPSTPSSPMPTMDSQRRDAAFSARADQATACHASSYSAAQRKRGSWPARLAEPRRSRRDAVARRAARLRRLRQRVPVRVGGFGGDDGLADYLSVRAHRCADRRDASLRGRHLRQCGASRAHGRRALAGAAAAAMDAAAGDHWTEVTDAAGGGARAR